jgi:hypothetical protein
LVIYPRLAIKESKFFKELSCISISTWKLALLSLSLITGAAEFMINSFTLDLAEGKFSTYTVASSVVLKEDDWANKLTHPKDRARKNSRIFFT